MSVEAFQTQDAIACPNCGIDLIAYSELVDSLRQGLFESSTIERRRARAKTRKAIVEELERLGAL